MNIFSTSKLKIDGVYYRISGKKNYNYKNEYINTTYLLDLLMLYNNKLAITTIMSRVNQKLDQNQDSLNSYISEMIKNTFGNKEASFRSSQHGGFSVNGNNITIQTIRIYHWGSFFVSNYIGEIINDSTIHISRYELLPDDENRTSRNIDEYYHFIPLAKPDSVINNRWSKNKWYWKNE